MTFSDRFDSYWSSCIRGSH